jgi:hypothetical protein
MGLWGWWVYVWVGLLEWIVGEVGVGRRVLCWF